MKKRSRKVSVLFMVLATLFSICLVGSNLFAVKPFNVGLVSFTGAIILFPVSYIINDVVSEVWGYRHARMLVFMAFLLDLFFVLVAFLVDLAPGAPWWDESSANGFHSVFGLAPRVAFASFGAFIVGSLVNAKVMTVMKEKQQGRRFWLRAVTSSLVGELCDSLIFFPIALAGSVIPWSQMPQFVLWQVGLKTGYEIIILPITIRVVHWVKKVEK